MKYINKWINEWINKWIDKLINELINNNNDEKRTSIQIVVGSLGQKLRKATRGIRNQEKDQNNINHRSDKILRRVLVTRGDLLSPKPLWKIISQNSCEIFVSSEIIMIVF